MKNKPLYLNPNASVAKRVDDLLSRMTVEEKVGQMCQLDGRKDLEENFRRIHPGSFLHVLNETAAPAIRLARESRLGIPLLLGIDAIHGHSFQPGATIFPTQLSLACSWNPEAAFAMGEVTAREMRYSGVSWAFSPVLCLARDLRWGRVGETFGEDPYLAGELGCGFLRGLQGDDPSDPDHALACAKHYAGYCETQGGRDASECDLTRRKFRSFLLPPFEKAAAAGAGSFMTGYQSTDGVPMTVNRWALRKILREEWNFDGVLVTDWANVRSLVTRQKVCADMEEAARRSVESGNDLIMNVPEFFDGCLAALADHSLDIALVDEAVRRILSMKFRLGLFENDRMPDPVKLQRRIGTSAHRKAALQAARESVVLVENKGILPLNVKEWKEKRILLTGINADDPVIQNGDWSLGTGQANRALQHPREATVTVRDALLREFPDNLTYAPHAEGYLDADLIIAVVGDARYLRGECHSTGTLELQDGQQEMLNKIAKSGIPYIIVLLASKPMVLPELERRLADAVLVQFCPGMLGGTALADVLTGRFNPCGRLPVTMPRHVGQLPCYYNQIRGQHGDRYADLTQKPLYPFGYGLSYSGIEYVSASLDRAEYTADDVLRIRVKLRNRSGREAVETTQFYLSDCVTSATWADEELKGYRRVTIAPKSTAEAEFFLPLRECSIVNADEKRVVEPGEFELRVGPDAATPRFTLKFRVV